MTPREGLFHRDWEILAGLQGSRPVLVHLLEGFVDGGAVTAQLSRHLMGHCDPVPVGVFDVDELIQFRDRRPTMTYSDNRWQSVAEHEIGLYVLQDQQQQPFLLLRGLEPDLRWNQVAAELVDLVDDLDIAVVASASGAPMGVPHTRPLTSSIHGTRDALVPSGHHRWTGTMEIPASFAAFLEFTLGEFGRDAVGIHVHVPHYLAQGDCPDAAQVALTNLATVTGLDLPLGDLPELAQRHSEAVAAELADQPDVQGLIAALEEQYDAHMENQQVPSGDEIAAEFERFLAQREDDE